MSVFRGTLISYLPHATFNAKYKPPARGMQSVLLGRMCSLKGATESVYAHLFGLHLSPNYGLTTLNGEEHASTPTQWFMLSTLPHISSAILAPPFPLCNSIWLSLSKSRRCHGWAGLKEDTLALCEYFEAFSSLTFIGKSLTSRTNAGMHAHPMSGVASLRKIRRYRKRTLIFVLIATTT